MTAPTDTELTDAYTAATRSALTALFAEYPEHRFYYIALCVSDESLPAFLAAESEEFLAQIRRELNDPVDARWNYAYSPVLGYGMDDHYAEVQRLLDRRPDLQELGRVSVSLPEDGVTAEEAAVADAAWDAEYGARMAALEACMVRLDAEGLFGTGDRRAGVLVLVENVPWDDSNVARVRRLNPPGPLLQDRLADNGLDEPPEQPRELR